MSPFRHASSSGFRYIQSLPYTVQSPFRALFFPPKYAPDNINDESLMLYDSLGGTASSPSKKPLRAITLGCSETEDVPMDVDEPISEIHSLGFRERKGISSLPVELMIQIFVEFANVVWWELPEYANGMLLRLSHVCRHWYYIMGDMSELWSELDVRAHPALLNCLLGRTKSRPIHLSSHQVLHSSVFLNVWPLYHHAKQVDTIRAEFANNQALELFFSALNPNMVNLREISLEVANPCRCGVDHNLLSQLHCPSLRILSTTNLFLSPHVYTHNGLETLVLKFTTDSPLVALKVVTILKFTSHLKQLTIIAAFGRERGHIFLYAPLDVPDGSIRLPHLLTLTLVMCPLPMKALLRKLYIPRARMFLRSQSRGDDISIFDDNHRRLAGCTSKHRLAMYGNKIHLLPLAPQHQLYEPSESDSKAHHWNASRCKCPRLVCVSPTTYHDHIFVRSIASICSGLIITHLRLPPQGQFIYAFSSSQAFRTLFESLPHLEHLDLTSVQENDKLFTISSSLCGPFDSPSSPIVCPKLKHIHIDFSPMSSVPFCLGWLLDLCRMRWEKWKVRFERVTFDDLLAPLYLMPPNDIIDELRGWVPSLAVVYGDQIQVDMSIETSYGLPVEFNPT